MKVTKTDQVGDQNYYALGDVEWAVKPNGDDPGICYPKPGAIPRDKNGKPIDEEDEYEEEYLDSE